MAVHLRVREDRDEVLGMIVTLTSSSQAFWPEQISWQPPLLLVFWRQFFWQVLWALVLQRQPRVLERVLVQQAELAVELQRA